METFYIVKIGIRNSDLEATQTHAIKFETDKLVSIEEIAEGMAKTFYGEDGGDEDEEVPGQYSWNDGEAVTFVESITEVSENEYIIIQKYVG